MKILRSRMLSFIAYTLLSLTAGSIISGATSYYVSTNGYDLGTRDGLDPTSAWYSISYALSCASSGAVIHVDSGIYYDYLNITQRVTITGTNSYSPSNPLFSRHVSSTIIKPLYTNNPNFRQVIFIATNGVTIQNLTIEGDVDSNGTQDVEYGIYTTNKPININHCVIQNINGFGIACNGEIPAPNTNDNDTVRSYFGYNLITNITSTNAGSATAIYLRFAPATCEFNEIAGINGTNANAGIYLKDCKYTINTANWVNIRSNTFDHCTMAIWANQFGGTGEKIIISGNNISNGVIGIRVTAAEGQALILNNNVSVSGTSPTTNATPARGIWIQADTDPWGISNTLMQTDHLVFGNTISCSATGHDGTVGMLLTYDTATWTNINNGTRATILNNIISGFDYGAFISSGTNGVKHQANPLVRTGFHSNDFINSYSYGIFATGITEVINASNNWWGSYFGPTGAQGSAVSTNVLYSWPLGAYLFDTDGNGTNDWIDQDDDGDGIPDIVEISSGLSPDSDDTDSDGSSDNAEIIAGTDPTNALSFFQISGFNLDSANNWPELYWMSVTGRMYSVYRSTNLQEGFSLKITNNIPPNLPSLMNTYTDMTATGTSPYYYRIAVTN